MDRVLRDALLAGLVGRTADVSSYDRSPENRSPLNFVLDRIAPEIAAPFELCWVNDGLPELFCLSGTNTHLIVYNTRQIELTYLIRRLIVDTSLDAVRVEVAERTCLRVMSELAVRHESPEWAVRAYLKSVVGETFVLADVPGSALMELEMQPIGEAYMAIWFHGLAHEFGHLCPDAVKAAARARLGPAQARAALQRFLDAGFPLLPGMAEDIWRQVDGGDPRYCLALEALAEEAFADWFASFQVYNATRAIMDKIGTPFDIAKYAREQCVAVNVVSLLERCRRMAAAAHTRPRTEGERHEMLLRPLSYAVRRMMVRPLLDRLVAIHLDGDAQPSPEALARAEEGVDAIEAGLQAPVRQIEKGLSAAMRFALFPAERDTDLMRRYARQRLESRVDVHAATTDAFCALVESFHGPVDGATALRRVAAARVA